MPDAAAGGYRFPKSRHLRTTAEITAVFGQRRRHQGEMFQVSVRPNGLGHPRLAVIVSKKTARRAVARNYMKRMIRESFRLAAPTLAARDIVVQARRPFARVDHAAACGELERLFDRAAR